MTAQTDSANTPASPARAALAEHRCWVIKIGSALITHDGRGLAGPAMAGWAADIAALHRAGKRVVLVCSGAVASGVARLGLAERPQALHLQQAVAAVGQMGLVQAWETAFAGHSLQPAQVLLTHHDLSGRQRYLNARSTLRALLDLGVVPVVNENDTVASDELRLGDNDTLAALVANLVDADALLLLTDQAGLHRADPRQQPDAPLVAEAMADAPELDAMAGGGGVLGRGGMITKVRAARLAARSGAATLIADGRADGAIARATAGEAGGTLLLPGTERLAARKQWIAGHLQTAGQLVLDEGAVRVLRHDGRSLLPVGVLEARGSFRRGDVVAMVTPGGQEVARGLVNYASDEVARMAGMASDQVAATLGYQAEPELVHRDNLVLVAAPSADPVQGGPADPERG